MWSEYGVAYDQSKGVASCQDRGVALVKCGVAYGQNMEWHMVKIREWHLVKIGV